MIQAATSSREIEAILLGEAPAMQIGMHRVGDDSGDHVATWADDDG